MKKLLLVFAATGIAAYATAFGTSAAGELTGSRAEPTQIVVGGSYIGAPTLVVSWDIDFNIVGGYWEYEYTFTDSGAPAISHFIMSLSPDCTGYNGCVNNLTGDYEDVEFGTFGPHSSNPGFPVGQSIFGFKVDLDDVDEDEFTITFTSNRAPVYGHIYGKGGSSSYFYNAGLVDPTSTDPFDYIVRPNGEPSDDPVPEPGSFALLGLGAVAIGLYRRTR